MIYYFGIGDKVRVIVGERNLTEEDKQNITLTANEEQQPLKIMGKQAVRYIDPTTKVFSWNYIDFPTKTSNLETLQKWVQEGKITQEEMNELL